MNKCSVNSVVIIIYHVNVSVVLVYKCLCGISVPVSGTSISAVIGVPHLHVTDTDKDLLQ